MKSQQWTHKWNQPNFSSALVSKLRFAVIYMARAPSKAGWNCGCGNFQLSSRRSIYFIGWCCENNFSCTLSLIHDNCFPLQVSEGSDDDVNNNNSILASHNQFTFVADISSSCFDVCEKIQLFLVRRARTPAHPPLDPFWLIKLTEKTSERARNSPHASLRQGRASEKLDIVPEILIIGVGFSVNNRDTGRSDTAPTDKKWIEFYRRRFNTNF